MGWRDKAQLASALAVISILTADSAYAQVAGEVVTFKSAAQQIVDKVAVGAFGAMATAITAALAIVAAITGSYKGAWAVLYVSIGLFILKPLCQLLFPGTF